MKRLYIAITMLAALAAGCTTNNDDLNTEFEQKTTISVEAVPESRTYTDGTNIYWAETGEQLNIIYFADESTSRRQSATHADYTLVDNRATFTADITKTDGAIKYTLGAYSPWKNDTTPSSIDIVVPQNQKSTATSFDPATDVLVSKTPVVVNGTPDKLKFSFTRLSAFAKMTIKGIPAGEQIKEVVFSSSAKPAGTFVFDPLKEATIESAVWYNNYEDITVTRDNWVSTGEDVVWFTSVPTDLSGKDFKVTVVTDKNNYVKEVDLTGKTLEFKRAEVAAFTVKDLTVQEKPKAYKLLTDINELNAGDKVVISHRNYATSSAKLLSNTPYDTSRTKLKFTSSATITSDIEIIEDSLPEGTAIFTLEAGDVAGTFAFKAEGVGYLYGAREEEAYDYINILDYSNTKVIGASWKVELNSNGASMSASYDGVNSRYLNNSYNNYFMYSTSRSTSYHYYIFYMDGESSEEPDQPEQPEQPGVTPLATPVVTATAEGNSVVVSWAAVAGAKNYTVTCGTTSFNTAETTATLANLEYATEYTVSVVANPADSTVNSASEAGTATVTTEAAPGGAEGLVVSLTLPVEGAVSGNKPNTFYEGDVTISSTGSWRVVGDDATWSGLYLGSGTNIKVAATDSSKHEITKVEMTAESGGSLNFRDFTSGSTLVWEPGYGASSKTFTAGSATRVASITVYYKAK